MSAGRVCRREVFLTTLHETAEDAAVRMAKERVGSLVVLDDAQRPVGVLTDRDLVVRVMARGSAAAEVRVGEVMTRDPHTVHQDADLYDALVAMRSAGARRLLVVDDAGRLVGVLTVDDVLDLLSDELRQLAGLVGRQEPRHATRG